MEKKSNIILFGGIIVLIIAAIALTSLIDFSKSNKKTESYVRASKSTSMVLTARVSSFDEASNTLLVDDVRFADTTDKTLGSWKVSPPAEFTASSYLAGTKIRIMANPVTFQISDKTLSAYEIEKQ